MKPKKADTWYIGITEKDLAAVCELPDPSGRSCPACLYASAEVGDTGSDLKLRASKEAEAMWLKEGEVQDQAEAGRKKERKANLYRMTLEAALKALMGHITGLDEDKVAFFFESSEGESRVDVLVRRALTRDSQ